MTNTPIRQAYIPDKTILRILEVENRKEWATSELYSRPIQRITKPKKKFKVTNIIKSLLP